jgi:hypothetical protein
MAADEMKWMGRARRDLTPIWPSFLADPLNRYAVEADIGCRGKRGL